MGRAAPPSTVAAVVCLKQQLGDLHLRKEFPVTYITNFELDRLTGDLLPGFDALVDARDRRQRVHTQLSIVPPPGQVVDNHHVVASSR